MTNAEFIDGETVVGNFVTLYYANIMSCGSRAVRIHHSGGMTIQKQLKTQSESTLSEEWHFVHTK